MKEKVSIEEKLAKRQKDKQSKRKIRKKPDNILFKLMVAERNFKCGMSASKSARLAKVDYMAAKQHLIDKGLIIYNQPQRSK